MKRLQKPKRLDEDFDEYEKTGLITLFPINTNMSIIYDRRNVFMKDKGEIFYFPDCIGRVWFLIGTMYRAFDYNPSDKLIADILDVMRENYIPVDDVHIISRKLDNIKIQFDMDIFNENPNLRHDEFNKIMRLRLDKRFDFKVNYDKLESIEKGIQIENEKLTKGSAPPGHGQDPRWNRK